MGLLHTLSVLSFLCIAVPRYVEGTYFFFLELDSFSNPDDRDHDGGCCEPGCGNCDHYFIFCLRQPGYDEDDNFCPYGSYATSANPISSSYITFGLGADALAPNVPNPVRFAGNTWPGGFQLKIRALDADADADDLVDYFIIEVPEFLPTDEYTNFVTYYGDNSNNVQITLRYKLRCRGNWHGHDCSILCNDVDTEDAHLECALDGSHVCMDGWQDLSTDCTVPVCQEGCNPGGGTCDLPGECNCEPGWGGDLCDTCVPSTGCDHGFCNFPNECICEAGFTGTLCNIALDPCDYLTPCVHGNCSNEGDSSYLCTCEPGYSGINCETDINDCIEEPCLNGGICEDLVNGFLCSCAVGWTGDVCGDNIDECIGILSPCKNGSTCIDCTPTLLMCPLGYTCDCLDGFYGDNCDLDIDHCSPDLCLNGGICHDGLLDYTCVCPPGFTGHDCETEFDYCQEVQPCENGSTCSNLLTVDLYSCECAAGFTGRDCDININDCLDNQCISNNTRACVDRLQGYDCDCRLGYEGTYCEIEIDECELFGCLNGGTCEDEIGDFKCVCPNLYTGKECEEPLDGDQCNPSPCLNEGICIDEFQDFKCQCPPNYKGQLCEEISAPGPTSDPCGDITCKEGETCIVDVETEKCVPCIADSEEILAGCDMDIAAQSDNKDSTNNAPTIIGSTVGGIVLLLILLLILVLLCCCHSCCLILCPCLGRKRNEEYDVPAEPGTLSGPYSSVSHNTTSTLTNNNAMQNPMYAAPGGVRSDSLTKVPLNLPNGSASSTPQQNGGHTTRPISKSYENVAASGRVSEEANEDNVDHPYEQLEGYQMKALTDEYQRVNMKQEEDQSSDTTTPYAMLYNVPSNIMTPSNYSVPTVAPPAPPPRPPHYMPLLGCLHPENPYTIAPGIVPTPNDVTMTTTSPATPEKKGLAKEEEEENSNDPKLAKKDKPT